MPATNDEELIAVSDAGQLAEVKARHKARTPGPYYWRGYASMRQFKLMALSSMRPVVLDFVRWGMNGAAPRLGSMV